MPTLNSAIKVSRILDAVYDLNFSISSMNLNITEVSSLGAINMTTVNSLSYLSDIRQLKVPLNKLEGLVLISQSIFSQVPVNGINCDYLVIDDAKYLYAYVYNNYTDKVEHELLSFSERYPDIVVSHHGYISEDARFGPNISLGKHLTIHGGVHVFANTIIGDRVSIKPNSVIGGDGFGYAIRVGQPPLKMPHFGGVQIGNDVEIGSCTNIDRGNFGYTMIADHVKIDNGVHIAHNVSIGARSLIIAHAEISGSTILGEDVWIAPNVSVREKILVGNRAIVGMGTVVTKDVPADTTVYGVPARQVKSSN